MESAIERVSKKSLRDIKLFLEKSRADYDDVAFFDELSRIVENSSLKTKLAALIYLKDLDMKQEAVRVLVKNILILMVKEKNTTAIDVVFNYMKMYAGYLKRSLTPCEIGEITREAIFSFHRNDSEKYEILFNYVKDNRRINWIFDDAIKCQLDMLFESKVKLHYKDCLDFPELHALQLLIRLQHKFDASSFHAIFFQSFPTILRNASLNWKDNAFTKAMSRLLVKLDANLIYNCLYKTCETNLVKIDELVDGVKLVSQILIGVMNPMSSVERNYEKQFKLVNLLVKHVNNDYVFETCNMENIKDINRSICTFVQYFEEIKSRDEIRGKLMKLFIKSILTLCEYYSKNPRPEMYEMFGFAEWIIVNIVGKYPNYTDTELYQEKFLMQRLLRSMMKIIDIDEWMKSVKSGNFDYYDFEARKSLLWVICGLYQQCLEARAHIDKVLNFDFYRPSSTPLFRELLSYDDKKYIKDSRILEKGAELLWEAFKQLKLMDGLQSIVQFIGDQRLMAEPQDDAPTPIKQQIVKLNVGGRHFSTSANTLNWIPDTFFTSLLSGRMHTVCDESGAIFIDRDPDVFKVILNYLRTKQVDLSSISVSTLKHEAQFFGLTPLIRRLTLCEELDVSSCGSVLFHGMLSPPDLPFAALSEEYEKKEGPRKKVSYELSRCLKNELSRLADSKTMLDPVRVRMIRSHNTTLIIAYAYYVVVFKDYNGWAHVWTSPRMKSVVKHISVNSKISQAGTDRLLSVAFEDETLTLWSVEDNGNANKKGSFTMAVPIDNLFFVGTQMVALSRMGKVGIWHSATQNWQAQDVAPISCYDTAGSSLLLGCNNGSLYYIDMQKFPLRMKDNDLLVTELYKDPSGDCITSISVFLTPKTSVCGNWIEIAYGTAGGTVRVIVQHPETVGHGPQLFQTYNVHNSAVSKIALTTGHLISVCAEYNHVRSWIVTRFRGMISTQPGTMSLASFKVLTLDSTDESVDRQYTDPGPYGDQDSEQVFIQRIVPSSDQVFVRAASTGERICIIKSIDGNPISAFAVHECDGASRIGNRPRRFLFCGSTNGSIQMWDLTTALDQFNSRNSPNNTAANLLQTSSNSSSEVIKPSLAQTVKVPPNVYQGLGGPSPQEFLNLIDDCEICCNSLSPTPCSTPIAK
ncbi:unnamed protein product [Caenorhabditis bovis]|uniref:BTB domain-containing protein n=1 Tax=Caenorhabditis bovis TaxID=2654633 RepID=A0A8S1EDY7_9PELO|nr:unnamed protein product [Caenorhabditis bovis]